MLKDTAAALTRAQSAIPTKFEAESAKCRALAEQQGLVATLLSENPYMITANAVRQTVGEPWSWSWRRSWYTRHTGGHGSGKGYSAK
jgi:hypothetical protein